MNEDELKAELREIKQLLQGDDYDRDDHGLIGDVAEIKRYVRWLIRLGSVVGTICLTGGVTVIVTRLSG